MKINYHNENYKGELFSCIICLIVLLFVLAWGIGIKFWQSISGIIFTNICIIMVIPWLILSLKNFKKKKHQRNMNIYIMKNGYSIDGRIISIEDKYSIFNHINHVIRTHNITATIEYNEGKEVVVVDNLCINYKKIKKYQNKNVKIYVYNNMNYIDIIN